jgi:hypothetical protein
MVAVAHPVILFKPPNPTTSGRRRALKLSNPAPIDIGFWLLWCLVPRVELRKPAKVDTPNVLGLTQDTIQNGPNLGGCNVRDLQR